MCHFHRQGLIFCKKVFSANIILCTSYLPLVPPPREGPVKITCRFYRLRYPPQLYRALRRTSEADTSPLLSLPRFSWEETGGVYFGPQSFSFTGHSHMTYTKFRHPPTMSLSWSPTLWTRAKLGWFINADTRPTEADISIKTVSSWPQSTR